MKAPLSYTPALPAALGLVVGIILHSFLHSPLWLLLTTIVVFVLLYSIKQHYFSFIVLFMFVGMLISIAHEPAEINPNLYDCEHTYSANINTSDETSNATSYLLTIDSIDGQACPDFYCKLIVLSVSKSYIPGTKIAVRGRLQSTLTPYDVPHQIDYNRFLRDEGIYSKMIVAPTNIHITHDASSYRVFISKIRDRIYNAIVTSPVNSGTASFLVASILGNDNLLSNDEYQNYRIVGVSHILALSGLHVGILASLISILLFPLICAKRGRIIRPFITLLLIWTYTIIVGGTPSIVRAAVMITVFILSRQLQRGYSTFNSLFLSIIIILCINPAWLYAPGFQLSVAAVASILMFGGLLPDTLRRKPTLYYVLNLMIIPIAAMVGTGMLTAYYFNIFPGLFLVSNVFVGIIFPWILVLGIIVSIFNHIGFGCIILGEIVNWLYDIMSIFVRWLASIDSMNFQGIYFSAWLIPPYYILIILIALYIRYRKSVYMISSMVIFIIFTTSLIFVKEDIPDTELYIPPSTDAPYIIMRSGKEARLLTLSADSIHTLENCNKIYKGYLLSRGCEQSFVLVDSIFTSDQFKYKSNRLETGELSISIVDNRPMSHRYAHTDYVIVCRDYDRDISSIMTDLNPDTILLSGDMHPLRRTRLVSECADSVPYIDLRKNSICPVW